MRYSWAIGTALLWAIAPSFAKLGLSTGVPMTIGTFIALAVTLPFLYGMATLMGNRPRLWGVDRNILLASLASGILNALATLSYFIALNLELVSVVVAVSCVANPLVAMLVVRLFFKEEKLSRQVVVGTVLAITGTIIIVS